MKCSQMLQTAIILCTLVFFVMPGTALCDKDKKKDEKSANAAIVNGKPITMQDFEWEVGMYQKRMQAQGNPDQAKTGDNDKMHKEVLDDMINQELVYQKAIEQGISVNDQTLKDELSNFKQRFSDENQFNAMLAQMNLTEERLKQHFARQQVLREFVQKEILPKANVTDKDVEAYYNENKSHFTKPEEVKAQHILIKLEKDATDKQKAEARKKLTELKKQIDAGKDFGELAKANSQCPSASQGGDLGFFSKGRMVPEFEKAAFALKPGQVSDIVETQFGYHLIKVTDYHEAGEIGLDAIKPRIMGELRNRKIQSEAEAYAAQLRKAAKIEILTK